MISDRFIGLIFCCHDTGAKEKDRSGEDEVFGDDAAIAVVETGRQKADWKSPRETQWICVTREGVAAQIYKIDQLAIYCWEYQAEKSPGAPGMFWRVCSFPAHTIVTIRCTGMVKVGYDMEQIVPTVDNSSKPICISLPEAQVRKNYILWERVECEESNNIFNPLDFARYQEMIADLEAKGLQQVEKEGNYDAAKVQIKRPLQGFLSGSNSHEAVF